MATTRTERARAFLRRGTVGAAQAVHALPYGYALTHGGLRDWRDLNCVVVTDAGAAPDAAVLIADAERHHAGLPELQVRVEGLAGGERLQPAFTAAGWTPRDGVLMDFRGPAPADTDPRVRWCAPQAVAPLRAEWLRAELAPAQVDAGVAFDALFFDQYVARWACVREGDGAPVAMASLLGDGATRMVEDVYTTPGARGRGLAAALVRRLVATALAERADLVFLPTETLGGARALYERLGFRELGRTISFTRAG